MIAPICAVTLYVMDDMTHSNMLLAAPQGPRVPHGGFAAVLEVAQIKSLALWSAMAHALHRSFLGLGVVRALLSLKSGGAGGFVRGTA